MASTKNARKRAAAAAPAKATPAKATPDVVPTTPNGNRAVLLASVFNAAATASGAFNVYSAAFDKAKEAVTAAGGPELEDVRDEFEIGWIARIFAGGDAITDAIKLRARNVRYMATFNAKAPAGSGRRTEAEQRAANAARSKWRDIVKALKIAAAGPGAGNTNAKRKRKARSAEDKAGEAETKAAETVKVALTPKLDTAQEIQKHLLNVICDKVLKSFEMANATRIPHGLARAMANFRKEVREWKAE
jgi:hypothetical protein